MAADISSSYNHTHRAFLQALLARGSLTFTQSQPLLSSILSAASPHQETNPSDITPADLSSYISSVNSAISPFDMEIRSTIPQDPSTGPTACERVYALVNTTSDPITQLATSRSADEMAYLKRLLDGMFDGPANTRRAEVLALTSLQALALSRPSTSGNAVNGATQGSNAQGLTKSEAERVLEGLVAEGWLDLSRKGYYRLSARALVELRTWLVETYNIDEAEEDEDEETRQRVRFCAGCAEIVIVGQRCGDLSCGVRIHEFCVRNVLRAAGGEHCPKCRRQWTGDAFVGEKAASSAAAGRRSTGTGNSGRRRSQMVEDDGDDE